MARKPTQAEVFDALLAQYEGRIADELAAAFADLRNSTDLQRVTDALSRGDIEDAIRGLHLDPAAFHGLTQSQRDAFIAAGVAAVALLPTLTDFLGRIIVIRFDPATSAAANFLGRAGTDLTGRILADQQVAIRTIIADGLANNVNPRSLALEIVGRINPASGAREGGIIGLTQAQAQFAQTARAELESGDVALLRNYLARTLRDQRFDAAVSRAIEDGTPISPDLIDKAVLQYQNRLLLMRGRTVGLAEANQMLHAGQDAAFDQVKASGALSPGDVIMGTWRQVERPTKRETHAELNGESQPHGMPFQSPTGALLMYPGDQSLGADASDVANCACQLQKRIVFRSNNP